MKEERIYTESDMELLKEYIAVLEGFISGFIDNGDYKYLEEASRAIVERREYAKKTGKTYIID